MSEGDYNVLFLCTGNSARSILAESILNRQGGGRFMAYSAGSQPKGAVHPEALDLLKRFNYITDDLRSKDWNEFTLDGAPSLDFVFTVCDNAAGEVCPVWPGQPMTAHWGIEDPAAVTETGEKLRQAFKTAYFQLERRLQIFLNLPMASMDKMTLQNRLDSIGQTSDNQGSAA